MAYSIYFCKNILLVQRIFLSVFLLFFFVARLCAQTVDTAAVKADTAIPLKNTDTVKPINAADTIKTAVAGTASYKIKNKLLNDGGLPVWLGVQQKNVKAANMFFYVLLLLVLMLACLKYFYSRYFINLFRVFFNTSLRQNQITDQLLQAKLPSFLFNVFFVVSSGIYVYLLLPQGQTFAHGHWLMVMLACIGLVGIVYLIKYCTLKFTGWLTGLGGIMEVYAFVIFLINKIIGILLVPFTVIIAFADAPVVKIAMLVSGISIGIFLLLRFFRSYGLLQNQLKISRFHFVLYIASLEVLPLLLIYKALMFYLTKNM